MPNDDQPWLTGIPLQLLLSQLGDPIRPPVVGRNHPFMDGDEVLVDVRGYEPEHVESRKLPDVCRAKLVVMSYEIATPGSAPRLRIQLTELNSSYLQWGFWPYVVAWRPANPERLK